MSLSAPQVSPLFQTRRAGVLLHPTSLPNEHSFSGLSPFPQVHGCLGKDAYLFVDFMAEAGTSVWQMLPTGPTHADLSPYQSVSSHAGNPDLISIDWLVHKGWIQVFDSWYSLEPSRSNLHAIRKDCSDQFYELIHSPAGVHLAHQLAQFRDENAYWLDDFVLFMALRNHFNNEPWHHWSAALRHREADALEQFRKFLASDIAFFIFEQFAFAEQWRELREYAREKGIFLFGDMPIFVAHDSADVWAAQSYFNLDADGNPLTVAGVPPDYFSETGQHWGNPHYNWQEMEARGFDWWIARLRTQLMQFDLIRIDHFRGFEAYWSIPGDSHDARLGEWVKAPGEAFLTACFNAYPELPLVAENLGLITPEVEALRHQFQLPGMLVLQFAFDGNNKNPHLPHRHTSSDVIYTGTHDNDTTLGWYQGLSPEQQAYVSCYLLGSQEDMPWLLIDTALASVSPMAVIPMQDILSLDGQHRMNMPGTTGKNWSWQFQWNQLARDLGQNLRNHLQRYDRLG